MLRSVLRIVCASLGIGSISSTAGAQAFTRIASFGDSLTDVGNASSITFGISPGSHYYNGRYSNGPVWAEGLAGDLRVAVPTASRKGGFDYAVGGSETGAGNTSPFPFINLPNAGTQIDSYLAGNAPGSNDLVTLWTGANDFLDGQTDPSVPAANVRAHVERLVNAGVKNLLVFNLPPLGETPRYRTTADRATMDARAAQFNANIASGLDAVAAASPGVTIYRADVFDLFNKALANPAAYGFTNVTDPALRSDNTVAADADQYLFYDNVHPTRSGHALLANYTFDLVETRTWTSALGVSGSWSTASNWVQRRVPDTTSAVVLDGASPYGVTLNGDATVRRLTVGSTPNGALTNTAPVTFHLTGGTLTTTESAVTINRGGTFAGRGTLSSDAMVNAGGTLSPGETGSGGEAIGQLVVAGALKLAGGVIRFDLGDVVSDRVMVAAAATLNGEVAIRFMDGFVGLPGRQTTLFDFASMNGTPVFANETGFAGLSLTPIQTATSFAVRLDATRGDANLDGHVDFVDLLALARHYGTSAGQTWLTGDFTGDASVSFDDLLALARNYNAGNVGASNFDEEWSLARSLVPEPSSIALCAAALLLVTRRSRSSRERSACALR